MTRYHTRQIDLSPWVRAVVGDTSDLSIPAGYRITGQARTPNGPWTLDLWGASDRAGELERVLASHVIRVASDVRPYLESLVNLAAIHEYERGGGLVVRTDREGWVREIADA